MMTKRKYLLQLLVLGIVGVSAGFASTAVAQSVVSKPAWFKPSCGNGIVETYSLGRDETYNEECDPGESQENWIGQAPACTDECRFDQSVSWNFDSNDGILERNPVPLPETLDIGEECDSKLVFTCNSGKYPRSPLSVMGNGVLDPDSEECDDGNNFSGDGCSATGVLERTARFHEGVCGNGVKEGTEDCDDGNRLNGDGCSSTCELEVGDVLCRKVDVCGNGRVDIALGEQCDDGDRNGSEGSRCTEECIWKSSPRFKISGNELDAKHMAWWAKPKKVGGAYQFDKARGDDTRELVRLYSDNQRLFSVKDRGQRIVIGRDANKQYSGVFLSGQKLEDIPKYPGKKIDLQSLIYPTEPSDLWDDDIIGFVFGIKPGEQRDKDKSYFMLVWDSGSNFNEGKVNFGSTACNPGGVDLEKYSSKYGGLRLFQVTGNPTYEELWTMNNCPKEDAADHIKEISTTAISPWNKVVNPMYRTPNFYYGKMDGNRKGTYGLQSDPKKVRLQWRVEFTAEELKVWADHQLVMHVTKEGLETIENKPFTWPTSGEVGFYFLAMDNITADFRGFNAQVDPAQNYDGNVSLDRTLAGAESSVCSGYCGDGVVDQGEACDDGNRIDGDGCSAVCKIEKKPEVCKSIGGALVCYGGIIKEPSRVGTDGSQRDTLPPNPTIKGTYVGDPSKIWVTIKNDAGLVVCEGDAKKEPLVVGAQAKVSNDGLWTFDTAACQTPVNRGTYKVEAKFFPPNGVGEEGDALTTEPHTFNVANDGPNLKVTSPEGYEPAGAKSPLGNVTVTGTVDSSATVTVKWCPKDGDENACVTQDPDATLGTFTATVPADEGKEYTLTVTADKGGKTEVITKKVVVDNIPPETPDKVNAGPGETLIGNGDNTVTIQGTVPVTSGGGTPEYVKVEYGGSTVVVPVNKGKNSGDPATFEVDIPLEQCDVDNKICIGTLTVTAIDKAGNESSKKTVNNVHVARQKGVITIYRPTNAGNVSVKAIEKNEGKLPVSGEINAHAKQPVKVTVHPTKACDTRVGCDPDTERKCDSTEKLGEETVYAVNGKWSGDVKPSSSLEKDNYYCVVAEFVNARPAGKTQPTSAKTQSIFKVSEGRKDVGQPQVTLPGAGAGVCEQGSPCPDITARKQEDDPITIKLTASPEDKMEGKIKEGDTAEVRVGDDRDHPLYTKTCTYKDDGRELGCKVEVPAEGLDPDTEIHARTETPEGDTSDWVEFPEPSMSNENKGTGVTEKPDFATTRKEVNNPPANSKTVAVSIKPPASSPSYPDGTKGEVVVGNDVNNPLIKKMCTFVQVGGELLCTVDLPTSVGGVPLSDLPIQARAKAPDASDGNKKWSPWRELGPNADGVKVKRNPDNTLTITVDNPNGSGFTSSAPNDTIKIEKDGVTVECSLELAGGVLTCTTDRPFVKDGAPITGKATVKNGQDENVGKVDVPGLDETTSPKTGIFVEDEGNGKVKVVVDPNDPGLAGKVKAGNKVDLPRLGMCTTPLKGGRPDGKLWCEVSVPSNNVPSKVDVTIKDGDKPVVEQTDVPVTKGGVAVRKNRDGSVTVHVFDPEEAKNASGADRLPAAGDTVVLDNRHKCVLDSELKCPIAEDEAAQIGNTVNVSFEGGSKPISVTGHIKDVPVDLLDSFGGGLVAGGCGCSSADAPASGLVSLLLAALGLFAIRRRKE